ncbi:MAG: hypothetical protein JXA52_02950 [Planctomycetes bacterium]|nr:hypothetical protein [Planctomycetota bacterium]
MRAKLAGFFTMMAVVLLLATWSVRTLMGYPTVGAKAGMLILLGCLVLSYLFGRIVSWLGISLVQEEMAEKRAKEEALRHQLLMLEQETKRNEEVNLAKTRAGDT